MGKMTQLLFFNVPPHSQCHVYNGTISHCPYRCLATRLRSKIIRTKRWPKREGKKILFFYGNLAMLRWDPDRWRWSNGGRFLNTTKDEIETNVCRNLRVTRAAEKWQGYLSGNYRFYWSQVWDPHHAGKEAAFIWSILHKALAVNEWGARIASATISKQCEFVFLTRVR